MGVATDGSGLAGSRQDEDPSQQAALAIQGGLLLAYTDARTPTGRDSRRIQRRAAALLVLWSAPDPAACRRPRMSSETFLRFAPIRTFSRAEQIRSSNPNEPNMKNILTTILLGASAACFGEAAMAQGAGNWPGYSCGWQYQSHYQYHYQYQYYYTPPVTPTYYWSYNYGWRY